MEAILDQLISGNLNTQVPIGYMLAVFAVMFGVYVVVKKIVAVIAKISFAMLASGVLLTGGLAGSGYGIGALSSGSTQENKHNQYLISSKDDMKSLVMSANNSQLISILEYAKERDKLDAKNPPPPTNFIKEKEKTAPKDYAVPASILTFSLGLIICAVTWFIRMMK